MPTCLEVSRPHPAGESHKAVSREPASVCSVDTYGGKVEIRWDADAAVTAFGQMPYFIEFLKTAELFEPWVADCPLSYSSPNAPKKRDVVGTMLLSVLAGHQRYAHINALRGDGVNPELLGMSKVVSEDSVRRAFQPVSEEACRQWCRRHLDKTHEGLLSEPWILDIDSTVKPLYGHQQGAKRGYNPAKPGRPSHVYHTYFAANVRLVLEVEVQPGNQTAASYAQPGLWAFWDALPAECRAAFVRGDVSWGNEAVLAEAERRGAPYLFKLRQSVGVRKLIERLFRSANWTPAGQGWEGAKAELRLEGWSRRRQVLVLRRQVPREGTAGEVDPAAPKQLSLGLAEITERGVVYEYAVLVTSLEEEIFTLAQHYRDRAGAENNFDELKNQWGWAGFTTQDLKRCQLMAHVTALVYNWWTLFTRMAIPEQHAEAITSRPLLLAGIARRTRHANQTMVTITNLHAKARRARELLAAGSRFLHWVKVTAEQLSSSARWRLILSYIFRYFLGGRIIGSTARLAPAFP